MTASGDMLGLMDIVQEKANSITIGWDDETETKKAYNHNFGDTVKKRPFFGLTKGELSELVSALKPDVRRAAKAAKNDDEQELIDAIKTLKQDVLTDASDEG